MQLNNTQIYEIEKNLKENNTISNDDHLIVAEKGDYWSKFLIFNMQERGCYYFTNEKIIFAGGLGGAYIILNIPYKNIRNIKKCNVGLFIPCGILLTVYDENKQKEVKYRLSLLKRDNWIRFIEERGMNSN